MTRRRLFVLLLSLVILSFTTTVFAGDDPIAGTMQHTIAAGDTLYDIARAHNVDVRLLMEFNNISDARTVAVGQVIQIPDQNIAQQIMQGNFLSYRVQAGDTLSAIAVNHDVNLDALLAFNQGVNPRLIVVGQEVRIPLETDQADDDGGSPSPTGVSNMTSVPTNNSITNSDTIPARTYVIKAGDTLSQIAYDNDMTVAELLALNQPIDSRSLQVGQILVLEAAAVVAAEVNATSVNVPSNSPIGITPLEGIIPDEQLFTPPVNLEAIVSSEASITDLNVSDDRADAVAEVEANIEAVTLPQVNELVAPEQVTVAIPPAREPLLSVGPIVSNILPINIEITDVIELESAVLSINGTELQTYLEAPFTYDLDTALLDQGRYKLTFTLTSRTNGVTSIGNFEFDVQFAEPVVAPAVPLSEGALENMQVEERVEQPAPINDAERARIVLVNGLAATAIRLNFGLATGLTLAPEAVATPQQTLSDILGRPAQWIPEPIREALMTQRPELWSVVILILTFILLPQGLFTLYWMLYTWNNPEVADHFRSPKEFTTPQMSFTALLPARHEENVIKDTIRAVDRMNYPDHLKEILVLIRDEDDDMTIQRTKEAIAEIGKDTIKLVTFTDGPKNKPNGLNKGLRVAGNQVICVFDAEDEPHADLYNVINTVMVRDNADIVQAGVQLMNFKSTWFSALNCLEYFFWFKSGLHAFTRQFHVTPLGGNTVFFKKAQLDSIGGWDQNCLTEDADVGLRLTRLGAKIQIVYDEKHATQEETPSTVESFIKQRTRWCQGFYEVFAKGDWLRLPSLKQKITALYILLNSLLQAAIILYLPVGLYVALTQQLPVPIALISYIPIFMLGMQLVVNLIGIREFTKAYGLALPLGFRFKMILHYYPYQLMMAFSAFRAVGRFLSRQNAWEKTAHANLHRQSQSA